MTDRLPGADVRAHEVDFVDATLRADLPRGRVFDVDDQAELVQTVLVAERGRDLHRLAQFVDRRLLVAVAKGRDSVLHRVGVVGMSAAAHDLRAHTRRQRLVLGPDGAHLRLGDRLAVDDQAHAGGQHLLAGRTGRNDDTDVEVAGFVAPRAGGVV